MKKILMLLLIIFVTGFIIPEQHQMPVEGATAKDWNDQSFWYYPWGRSGVHKGIDIFADEGTSVIAPTGGFIIFNGNISMGGNVVYMIGPKWRFHYFAHMQKPANHRLGFIDAGHKIGRVGTTGNAAGKPPHLHYSIKTLYPQFWKYKAKTKAAWDRMFFINPERFLQS